MPVLELVKELTGQKIDNENSALFKVLAKLPSLEEDPKIFTEFDDSLALPGVSVERSNPLFFQKSSSDEAGDNLQQNAAEILERFEQFCEKNVKKTGIAEIDEIRKKAAYLRFIAQECAEITAAGKQPLGKEFSLEDWRVFSQEVFHDTGNNITLPLTTGKRKDGKFGAGSGGLGDKITRKEFDVIVAELTTNNLLESKTLDKLKDILIRADNVEIREGKYVFLNENIKEEKAKVRAITLARETCEELFEPYVQAVLLDPETDFVELIEKAFGKGEITSVALLMLQQIQSKVASIVIKTKEELIQSDIAGGLKKRLNDELAEIYKDEIEPYFARFLKISVRGKVLIDEMEKATGLAESANFRVNDVSFPQARLTKISEKKAQFGEKNRPTISIPQSNSLVVDGASCPILSSLSAATRNFIEKNPETVAHPIEYKGALHFETPAQHLKFLLGIYSAENAANQPSQMAYPHEIFVQIRAAIAQMKLEEGGLEKITKVFADARVADNEFDAKLGRRNEWLAKAGLTNLNIAEEIAKKRAEEIAKDVALEMCANNREIFIACFPKIFAVQEAISDTPSTAAEPRTESATYVVIVNSSEAFANPKNPMGASAEKVGPYEENVAKFLAQARQNGVDGYCLTTDMHPEDHQNFLKNLLQNNRFLQLYIEYVIKQAEKQGVGTETSKFKNLQRLLTYLNNSADKTSFSEKNPSPQDLKKIAEATILKSEVIKELDSLSPYGVNVSLPKLLQTLGEDGKSVRTVGVQIGLDYYSAGLNNEGAINISEKALALVNSRSLSKGAVVTEVSTLPSDGAISQHFKEVFKKEERFGFDEEFESGIESLIEELKNKKSTESVSSLSRTKDGVLTLVFGKGRDKSKENYSPFFSEAVGINREAMVTQLKALFEISKDATSLTIPVIGIAYDFYGKNFVLDTINFLAPALQALQLLSKQGHEVDLGFVENVVKNIADIVEKRIKDGEKGVDIKAKVSVVDALNNLRKNDYEYAEGYKVDDLLKINIVIPHGATIEISEEAKASARAEMEAAAKAQDAVTFSESEIENVFDASGSVGNFNAAAVLGPNYQETAL